MWEKFTKPCNQREKKLIYIAKGSVRGKLRTDFDLPINRMPSTKKDLVIQVLGVCYSDPELASMIEWREAYVEEWLSITEARKTAEPTALTGFIPELTAAEMEALYNYGKDTDGICSKMFKTDSRGKRTVDPDYLTYLDKFFEENANRY